MHKKTLPVVRDDMPELDQNKTKTKYTSNEKFHIHQLKKVIEFHWK
jgi:hypothetical protein